MDEYTPTTKLIEANYVLHRSDSGHVLASAAVAEFDRWLAEHDREVAAKALRDAADDGWPHVAIRAESAIFEALHLRADRIERGENP